MNRRRIADANRHMTRKPRLPRRTVRLRLTLLYGALFLISGAVLLATIYALVWNATNPRLPSVTVRQRPGVQAKVALAIHQHAALMHQLLVSGGIGLALTAVLSIGLGWLVAGRVLRPLRTMTANTQRISEQNLHQRLAIAGPDDELKRLGATIDDLLARLEGAFDAQRRFVANASHELRTPLTMMRTALDVATRKTDSPAPGVATLASKIRVGLDKADRLVDSFLTLARAQHAGTIPRTTVALDALAGTVLAEHSAAINDRRLTVDQNRNYAPVTGSEALLTHLVNNLIDNAIRHNQPGGWIHVVTATNTATDTAELTVENSGPVLEPATVGELLQPFRSAEPDRTTASDTGVGLGLSIASAIVTTHDGNLDLHARPGGGLRVTVTLPQPTRATLAAPPALTAAATP
jgi:signal transduction histidine kinase